MTTKRGLSQITVKYFFLHWASGIHGFCNEKEALVLAKRGYAVTKTTTIKEYLS